MDNMNAQGTQTTNLRTAKADVKCEGILSEKNLTLSKTDNGMNVIRGTVEIKTSDVNFIRFRVNVTEMTKQHETNPAWNSVNAVMTEYKSIAEVGEENADRIVANGKLAPFHSANNGDTMSYSCSFFRRKTPSEAFTPGAEFDVELFIASISAEMVDDNETGRLIIRGWMPTYNGIEPVQIMVPQEYANEVDQYLEPQQTVRIVGEAVNSRVEKQVSMLIGKKTETVYKNELVLTGMMQPYELDNPASLHDPYDPNVIRAAINERTERIKAQSTQNRNGNRPPVQQARPSAAAMGRTAKFMSIDM